MILIHIKTSFSNHKEQGQTTRTGELHKCTNIRAISPFLNTPFHKSKPADLKPSLSVSLSTCHMLCLHAPNWLFLSAAVMWPQTAQQQQISTPPLCSVRQAVHCWACQSLPVKNHCRHHNIQPHSPCWHFRQWITGRRVTQPDTYAAHTAPTASASTPKRWWC